MNTRFPNLSISLLWVVLCLVGCSGSGPQTIYIYNPSPNAITISIDDEKIHVPADSMIRQAVSGGSHVVKCGDRVETMEVSANTNILVNPTRAKLILREMLYEMSYSINAKAKEDDYGTPLTSIMIDSLRYAGHFKVTDEIIVKDWLFNIGQTPESRVDSELYMRKAHGGGGGNPTLISSYKLYTFKEFAASMIPLNRDKHHIEYILQRHLHKQTDEGIVFVNVYFLMAGESKDIMNAASVAKIHVTNKDEIYLKEPSLYKPSEHGKILGTPFTLTDCIVELDSTTVKHVAQVDLVKVEESLALKVTIKE